MTTCEHCSSPLDAQRSTRRYCDSACRGQAWRQRTLTDTPDLGANADALEELLERAEHADPAVVQAARSLATLVDANPTSGGLWARYLHVLDRLGQDVTAADDLAFAELMAQLQMPPTE